MCFPSVQVVTLQGAERQREMETVVAKIMTFSDELSVMGFDFNEAAEHMNHFTHFINITGKAREESQERREQSVEERDSKNDKVNLLEDMKRIPSG